MNKVRNTLSSTIGALLPFVFIGSAYLIIPKFQYIYDDMLGAQPLPTLTEITVSLPLFFWLFIALILATFNYFISTKEKNTALAVISILVTLLISGTIVISLFLPLVEGPIIKLPDDPQVSEQAEVSTPFAPASLTP
jgi:hypothetical protein